MESWEHGRGLSPAPSHRKMSFNPVGSWAPAVAEERPVRGSEVSKVKRICAIPSPPLDRVLMREGAVVQVTVAVTYCLLAAGVVFGYAALKPVLVKEGVYRDRCTDEDVGWDKDEGDLRTCYEQELR